MYITDTYLPYLSVHWKSMWDKNWTIWCGYILQENSRIYIFTGTIICIMFFSWLEKIGQRFSETWICMAGEVIYILYIYVFDLYFVSMTSMKNRHNHQFHKKDRICLFYYVQIHIYIYQICTLWTETQGYHLTQLVWRSWIIFCFLFYVKIFHLLWRQEDVGISWNKHQLGLSWLIQVTNGIKYYLLFQIKNLESALQMS